MNDAEVLKRHHLSEACKRAWADPMKRANRLAGMKRRGEQRTAELQRLLDTVNHVAEVTNGE